MGNSIAYLAIALWPLVTLFLINRFGFAKGALLSLLGAYMFLPAYYDVKFPGIPAFNKFSVTSMTLIAYMVFTRKRLGFGDLPNIYKILLVGFVVAPMFTAMTNSERYLHMPALTAYDAFTSSFNEFIYIIPFLIGFRYFRRYDDQLTLFKYFAIAALVYAVLALYEIRMSPQLHSMIYGYFPHSWVQQNRGGGFRAIVFMGHGLLVGLFLAIGVGVWATLRKNKERVLKLSISNTAIVLFMLVTLVLMKSLAALIFGLLLFLMITYAPIKKIYQVGIVIVIIFVSYPLTSALKIFPHQQLVDIAYSIEPERAQSLDFRFRNEAALLAHANDKPLFGWGGWGRNRVFDPRTGEDISVTDGYWIITLGVKGWFGFLTEFLLIILPIMAAYKLQKRKQNVSQNERRLLAAHALIITIILLDQMPNASLNILYLFFSGALLGRVYELGYLSDKKNAVQSPPVMADT